VKIDELADLVVPFKRPTYERGGRGIPTFRLSKMRMSVSVMPRRCETMRRSSLPWCCPKRLLADATVCATRGIMFDAKSLLDQFIGGQGQRQPDRNGGFGNQGGGDFLQQATQALSGFGGGAVAGGLAGLLLGSKSGRKLAGSAVTYGGMAVAGALALSRYQNWQAGKAATPAASANARYWRRPPIALQSRQRRRTAVARAHLLRAMIAAAKADGHIDAAEQSNIFAQMDRLNVGGGTTRFSSWMSCASRSTSTPWRARRAHPRKRRSYIRSLLAIDVDNPSERAYLSLLAARLNLMRSWLHICMRA